MRVTADDMRERARKARLLRSLSENPGWQVLAEIMQVGVAKRRDRLCEIDCGADETVRLRLEIDCIRTLLKGAEISDEKIQDYEERVAFLEKQEKIREGLGMNVKLQEQEP